MLSTPRFEVEDVSLEGARLKEAVDQLQQSNCDAFNQLILAGNDIRYTYRFQTESGTSQLREAHVYKAYLQDGRPHLLISEEHNDGKQYSAKDIARARANNTGLVLELDQCVPDDFQIKAPQEKERDLEMMEALLGLMENPGSDHALVRKLIDEGELFAHVSPIQGWKRVVSISSDGSVVDVETEGGGQIPLFREAVENPAVSNPSAEDNYFTHRLALRRELLDSTTEADIDDIRSRFAKRFQV